MPNLDAEISKHNLKTVEECKKPKKNKLCNCRNESNKINMSYTFSPIRGKCLTKSVVYEATVTHKAKNMSL